MYIIPGAKLAKKVDVNLALAHLLGASASSAALSACRNFQVLRAAIHEPPVSAAVVTGLQRYLLAVEYVQMALPSTDALGTPLLWVSGFAGDAVAEAADLALDRVSVVFNLGVASAHLGVSSAAAETEAGLKESVGQFRAAAGYFALAEGLPRPAARMTDDLSASALRGLKEAMLGNAQQSVVKLVGLTMPRKKGYAAMVAKGAAVCYGKAASECEDGSVKGGSVDEAVGESGRALKVYFEVVGMWLQGGSYHDTNDVAKEITQLGEAMRAAERGVRRVAGMKSGGQFAWIGRLKEEVVGKMETLVREIAKKKEMAEEHNRQRVWATPENSVAEVVARVVAKEKEVRGDVERWKGEVVGMLAGLKS